ncbi:MAG: hypothetical protein PVF28_00525 [Thioalkalispiraceae bacterium]|jgi:hypothetical protein
MILYSIIESPLHPQLSEFYKRQGLDEVRLQSVRKAIQELKKQPPDVVVADFIYGYGNNYAGVNISNLDVFLYSLEKYAPQSQVIVCYEKADKQYVQKLEELFPSITTLVYPVSESAIQPYLQV